MILVTVHCALAELPCACTVIWDALKAACEADLQTASLIVNSAGIIVTVQDMSTCFDERGQNPMLADVASHDTLDTGCLALDTTCLEQLTVAV